MTCDPPPPKFHGLYQCTNGFQFNSECRIKCEDSDAAQVRLPELEVGASGPLLPADRGPPVSEEQHPPGDCRFGSVTDAVEVLVVSFADRPAPGFPLSTPYFGSEVLSFARCLGFEPSRREACCGIPWHGNNHS